MPVTDAYIRLPLSLIDAGRDGRQRQSIDTKGLRESIKAQGVLNPIIVHQERQADGTHLLVAGERRLTACRELGYSDIPVRFAEQLSPIEAKTIELEENIKRLDLPWQELVRATEQIHLLYKSLNPKWTQEDTTEALSLTRGTVSVYLKVAGDMATNPRVAQAGTVREAYNMLNRRDSRVAAEALEEILGFGPVTPEVPPEPVPLLPGEDPGVPDGPSIPRAFGLAPLPPRIIPDPARSILHESFLQWAPRYTGPKFNFFHCDFPYGINLFEGPQAGGSRHTSYDDSPDLYFRLVKCLLDNLDRLMSQSAHVMFWYSSRYRNQTHQMIAELAPSLLVHQYDLIWLKSDNAGIASDPRQEPRHIYETAMFMTRGKRQIVRIVGDAYAAPTDKRLHPSTKPEPMLKHFFTMLVDEQTHLLDPTCGSGAAIRAAEGLGARTCLGMDTDEQVVGLARTALRQARTLRGFGPQALGL